MRGTESAMIARAKHAVFVSRWRMTLLMFLLAVACTRKHEVTPERCIDLRDHLVDLRLSTLKNINSKSSIPSIGSDHREAPPPPPVDIAAHRAALNQALGETFAANCMKNLAVDQLDCALAAIDSNSVDRCLTKSK